MWVIGKLQSNDRPIGSDERWLDLEVLAMIITIHW